MQNIDNTSNSDDGSEDSGIGAEPIDTKSAVKKQSAAANTDQNPDKV